MRKFLKDKIINPIFRTNPAPATLVVAFTSIWWGLIFLIMGVGGSIIGTMAEHASAEVWTIAFLITGIGIVAAKLTKCRWLERGLMLFSVAIWAFVSAVFIRSTFTVPYMAFSAGTYAILTISAAWAYWRLQYE